MVIGGGARAPAAVRGELVPGADIRGRSGCSQYNVLMKHQRNRRPVRDRDDTSRLTHRADDLGEHSL